MLFCSNFVLPVNVNMSQEEDTSQQKKLIFSFDFDNDEMILKQTIIVTSDSPYAVLSQISFSNPAIKKFLPAFQDSKEIFDKNFTISTTATSQTTDNVKTKVYISYLSLLNNRTEEKTFELVWNSGDLKATSDQVAVKQKYHQQSNISKKSYLELFQNIIKTTNNSWIRILFIFFLGLLLSLTPCIYPMIPITIGILHRQEKRSLIYNFLGSMCYAIGLSTTFAIMGLLAALAGASFGNLLSQPIFVSFLIIFIGLLSLSMIGIIEIPMPSFMKNNNVVKSEYGTFVSAFLFGLISGTIASPCVSPGLALVLTIVATIGNVLTGFWLLFVFGIGLSVPLILIGTFSSSLNILPSAGQWMIEIKKAIGFVMLATCFYYLNNIVSISFMVWLFVAYLLFVAMFYILDAQKSFDKKSKTIKSLVGIILL